MMKGDLDWIDHAALKRARCAPPNIALASRAAWALSIANGRHVLPADAPQTDAIARDLQSVGCAVSRRDGLVEISPGAETKAIFNVPQRKPSQLEMQAYDFLVSVYCRVGAIGAPDEPYSPPDTPLPDLRAFLAQYGYDVLVLREQILLRHLLDERGVPMRMLRPRPARGTPADNWNY